MDDATKIELEALKVEVLGMLIDNLGRLVKTGAHAPYGWDAASGIATRIRELAAEKLAPGSNEELRDSTGLPEGWYFKERSGLDYIDGQVTALRHDPYQECWRDLHGKWHGSMGIEAEMAQKGLAARLDARSNARNTNWHWRMATGCGGPTEAAEKIGRLEASAVDIKLLRRCYRAMWLSSSIELNSAANALAEAYPEVTK
jgi:hypothetical protein